MNVAGHLIAEIKPAASFPRGIRRWHQLQFIDPDSEIDGRRFRWLDNFTASRVTSRDTKFIRNFPALA